MFLWVLMVFNYFGRLNYLNEKITCVHNGAVGV